MCKTKPFDGLEFIIAYENEQLDHDEIVNGFQHLIDSGFAWDLQGHYGRTAVRLIENGDCVQN